MIDKKILAVLLLAAALPLPRAVGHSQSLGDLARRVRKERAKEGVKPVKVYTNDNILCGPGATAHASTTAAGTLNPQPNAFQGQATPSPTLSGSKQATAGEQAHAENKIETREYWRSQFGAVRAALFRAKEEEQLAGNELILLQVRQYQTLDPNLSKELDIQIQAKKEELGSRRRDAEKAHRALDTLRNKFKSSGAPPDWIETDDSP